jgi:hypothetical protein
LGQLFTEIVLKNINYTLDTLMAFV